MGSGGKLTLSFVLLCLILVSATAPVFAASLYHLEADGVYGHKMGMALTCDVIEPATGSDRARVPTPTFRSPPP